MNSPVPNSGPAPPPVRDEPPAKLLAIIVIYKMQPMDSPSFQTLLLARDSAADCCDVSILIADNTPGAQECPGLPDGVSYRAFPDNPGLATPYNDAVSEAELRGCNWLLTLDQDTSLPTDFLSSMLRHLRQHQQDDRIAGVVPCIIDNGTVLSPLRFVGGFFPRVLRRGTTGVSRPHTMALNSAALLRVSALKQVGGYDPSFPLNNSDTAIFRRLDLANRRLVVAGDVVVQHELAIMRRKHRMTPERYRQLLIDERHFWQLYMPLLGRLERLVRLLGRLVKGCFTGEESSFQRITLLEIRYRLSHRTRNREAVVVRALRS